jgi:cytochrome c oxidase subunit 2
VRKTLEYAVAQALCRALCQVRLHILARRLKARCWKQLGLSDGLLEDRLPLWFLDAIKCLMRWKGADSEALLQSRQIGADRERGTRQAVPRTVRREQVHVMQHMRKTKQMRLWLAALLTMMSQSALAAQPEPWGLGFQEAATPIMERVTDFHNLLLIIISLITLFVLSLLVYVMLRFNSRSNPVPLRTTHNTFVEIAWTVVPVVILVTIAFLSFKLLYFEDVIPKADMTVKVTARTWNWSYEYPDHGEVSVISNIVAAADLQAGQPRLLTADNPMVIPAGKTIRVLVTSAPEDILHAFAVPAFGVKIDAVPGRLNETWIKVDRPGLYYGQCSELCGQRHAFMPINVLVVAPEEFQSWVVAQGGTLPGAAPATASEATENPEAQNGAESPAESVPAQPEQEQDGADQGRAQGQDGAQTASRQTN